MEDTTQPGVRLSANTWERFRQYVQSQHGGVRGNLRTELEAALNNHMDAANGPNELERIENDVATIKAMLAEGEADGGVVAPTPTASEEDHTRTRESEKPAPNAPRHKKIEYLIGLVFDRVNADMDSGEVSAKDVRNIIRNEYGFEDRTADDYVETILDRVDAVEHPRHGATYVWGDRLEDEREKLREEADERLGTDSQ